jgi:hypothetical protein
MSINAATGYMSNEAILAWMEDKTEGLYDHMRDAMQGANTRSDAESALDDIKAAIVNDKGKDATHVQQMINDALTKYADVPEVAQVLQPMADKLNGEFAKAKNDAAGTQAALAAMGAQGANVFVQAFQKLATPATVTIGSDDSDAWSKQIGDKVDALGKQDQLDMVNIQEFNSQLNQAKQTASALMDAADKSASAIINHIA